VTLRAKTDYVQERDEKTGRTVIRKVGLAPVQREGLDFEFDVCGDLDQEHSLVISKSRCPALADAVISRPGKELADQLRAWLGQGEPVRAAPAPPQPAPVGHSAQTGNQTPTPAPTPAAQATNGHAPQDDDGRASAHTDATLAADLDAAFTAQAPAVRVRFPRNAAGMQEFIKLVEVHRPVGLGLDADARKDALNGKSVNKYMTDQGWQDDPAALDRVWAVLEAKVRATEAAEVGATE